jgi:hypothetical protein
MCIFRNKLFGLVLVLGARDYGVKRHFQQYFSYFMVRSVLLVEETGVPGENHRPAARY